MASNPGGSQKPARSQFTGAAGEFYVAYELSRKGLHAALTSGNALSVDVIVSLPEGENAIPLQVKTARRARRSPKTYNFQWKEWDVGRAKKEETPSVRTTSSNLWYALVDLEPMKQLDGGAPVVPEIFLVPARWIKKCVKPKHTRGIFRLPASLWHESRTRWNNIGNILANDEQATACASSVPNELLNFFSDRDTARKAGKQKREQ